jgi:hypothetical protein
MDAMRAARPETRAMTRRSSKGGVGSRAAKRPLAARSSRRIIDRAGDEVFTVHIASFVHKATVSNNVEPRTSLRGEFTLVRSVADRAAFHCRLSTVDCRPTE